MTIILNTYIKKINSGIYNKYPVLDIKQASPEWFKKIPQKINVNKSTFNDKTISVDISTLRSCPGFINLYKNGFAIQMWSDIVIEYDKTNDYWHYIYSDGYCPSPTRHDVSLYGGGFKEYWHIKLDSPWLIQSKENINFVLLEPSWSLLDENKNIRVMPGIINFSKTNQININLLIDKNCNKIFIKAGTILALLIPKNNKKIKIKNNLVSEEDFFSIRHSTSPYGTFKSRFSKLDLWNDDDD